MRRILIVLALALAAGLAVAQEKPPGGGSDPASGTASDPPPVPTPAGSDECGTAPEAGSADPTQVTFCWSQAEVDALPPEPGQKKSVAPPTAKEPKPKGSGSTAPPPAKPGGKGTSFKP